MRTFKTKDGVEWKLELTVGRAMSIRQADPRFNLFDGTSDVDGRKLYAVLIEDLPTFWEVLYLLVKPEADTRSVTAEAFGEAMSAECLLLAQAAFLDEWRDFFRGLQKPEQETALGAMTKLRKIQIEQVRTAMAGPQVAKAIDSFSDKIQTALNAGLGNLLASSESTPADTRSAS